VSLYDRAKEALEVAGLTVKRYGEHVGKATVSYIAIYDGGIIPKSRATGYRIIGVAAYAPLGKREEIEPMLTTADAAIRGIKMRSRGSPSAEGFDDAFKAHFQTIEYVAPCAM
jgi:hypothetical protein